jgi:hypothetical protein
MVCFGESLSPSVQAPWTTELELGMDGDTTASQHHNITTSQHHNTTATATATAAVLWLLLLLLLTGVPVGSDIWRSVRLHLSLGACERVGMEGIALLRIGWFGSGRVGSGRVG